MSSKSISKSVIYQLCGKFALQGIAFFTTPIFTRLLTPADYGYTALYNSWLSIFLLIIGLGVDGSLGNARIKYGDDKLDSYSSSIMSIACISFISLLLLIIFLDRYLVLMLGLKKELIYLLLFHSFFQFSVNFEVNKLDALKKVEKSTVISLVISIVVIFLSLFLVIHFPKSKAISKILGQAIPVIFVGFSFFILTYLKGKLIWNKEYNKYCLVLTLPLIFHSIGHLVFSQSDRIMIQKMQNESTLGVYSVVLSLCSVLSIIFLAINIAWVPFYYDYKREKNNKAIIEHSIRYIKFFTLITCGFSLLSVDVYKLLAPAEYWGGIKLLPMFVLSNYFAYLYLFPVNFEFFNEKTKLIPIATLLIAIINIGINWLLIPVLGMTGAAIGTLTAHFLLFLIHELFARYIVKNYELPWHVYLPGTICLLFVLLFSYFLGEYSIIRWSVALLIAIFMLADFIKNRSIF